MPCDIQGGPFKTQVKIQRLYLKFTKKHETRQRIAVCRENRGLIKDVPDFLDCVITCNESWVHYFNTKSKQESSHWKLHGSPRKKKVRQLKLAGKMHMVVVSIVEDPFIST